MSPKQTDPDLPRSVQERRGSRWPAAGLGALSLAVHAWDLLKEVSIIFIENEVTQSCLTLCDPLDCSLPGSSVHGVAKSQTRLSDFTFTFHFHALEKEMATHSSVLAWRIPGTGEPGGLPAMGSHRVGHD